MGPFYVIEISPRGPHPNLVAPEIEERILALLLGSSNLRGATYCQRAAATERQREPSGVRGVWLWTQRYGPELEAQLRRHLKPTHKSWRVDETYVRVKGRWCSLYRAIDSTGATIDFVLSGLRDVAAAQRLCRKALTDPSYPQPKVINTDPARLYGSAISGVK